LIKNNNYYLIDKKQKKMVTSTIPIRLLRTFFLLTTIGLLTMLDTLFVQLSQTEVWVPPNLEATRQAHERHVRIAKQKRLEEVQEMEVESSILHIDGVLRAVRLDPHDEVIKDRITQLKLKVGSGSNNAESLVIKSSSSSSSNNNNNDEDNDSSSNNDDDGDGDESSSDETTNTSSDSGDNNNEDDESSATNQQQSSSSSTTSIITTTDSTTNTDQKDTTTSRLISRLHSRNHVSSSLEDEMQSERWAELKSEETSEALARVLDKWISAGKTKRLGFDLVEDPIYAAPSALEALLLKKKETSLAKAKAKKEKEAIVEIPKSNPGDAQRRFVARTKPGIPKAFETFVKSLREARTYSHMNKAIDTERRLKALGYKQSTGHSGQKKPLFQGLFGETCPKFESGEKLISFCNHFLSWHREQEQLAFLNAYERWLKLNDRKLIVENFFPDTWRLYKQFDRRALRQRTQNETAITEGGPYVTKFTFSHGAGTPSLTVKMNNLLKKSDESTKMQVQEAKQKMIAQRYINNPYLYEGRKFIIRTWAIVLNYNPMIVLYHDGALLRSIPPYTPFIKRDGTYKRAAHFTNAQSTHKGTLRSSELYASLAQFQLWLNKNGKESPTYVRDNLRPRLKARMMFALYAMMRGPEGGTEQADETETTDLDSEDEFSLDPKADSGPQVKKPAKIPNDVAVVQPVCFDFLLDADNKLWLLGVQTTGTCAVNLGGDAFRPAWKVAMQTALADRLVDLGEEMLWRKIAGVKLNSAAEIFTDIGMDVLIDETLPGWSTPDELKFYANGGHIKGGLGATKEIDESTGNSGVSVVGGGGNNNVGGGNDGENDGSNTNNEDLNNESDNSDEGKVGISSQDKNNGMDESGNDEELVVEDDEEERN
jgi:hypothetical protein